MKLNHISEIDHTQNIIYCFIQSKWSNGDFAVVALSEDGYQLASHISSSFRWAKLDITNRYKWKSYARHYPFGYQLVWLDESDIGYSGFKEAIRLNHARHAQQVEV